MSTFESQLPLWFKPTAYGYRQHFTVIGRSVERFAQHGTVQPDCLRLIEGALPIHAGLYAGYMALLKGDVIAAPITTSTGRIDSLPVEGSSADLTPAQQLEINHLYLNTDVRDIQAEFGRSLDESDWLRVGAFALNLIEKHNM